MEIKNDKVEDDVLVEEDLSVLDDTTDWKAKAAEIEQKRREDGIKTRERTKALRDQLAELKSTPPPIKKEEKPEENGLIKKTFLRAAGISDAEEVELALSTAKKWGMDVDKLVDDEDWKEKLDKFRTKKSNELASSNIRGGQGSIQAKLTPEYWQAKGIPPSPADVPDRKTRAKIIRTMMASATTDGKKFYND